MKHWHIGFCILALVGFISLYTVGYFALSEWDDTFDEFPARRFSSYWQAKVFYPAARIEVLAKGKSMILEYKTDVNRATGNWVGPDPDDTPENR